MLYKFFLFTIVLPFILLVLCWALFMHSSWDWEKCRDIFIVSYLSLFWGVFQPFCGVSIWFYLIYFIGIWMLPLLVRYGPFSLEQQTWLLVWIGKFLKFSKYFFIFHASYPFFCRYLLFEAKAVTTKEKLMNAFKFKERVQQEPAATRINTFKTFDKAMKEVRKFKFANLKKTEVPEYSADYEALWSSWV